MNSRMEPGDLVEWTFAKKSKLFNKNKLKYSGILLKEDDEIPGFWLVLLKNGEKIKASEEELILIKKST